MSKSVNLPIIEIPYSHTSTKSYAMMRAFIKDFIIELQKTYIAKGSKPTDMWKIPALQLKYLWEGPEDSKEYSDKEIASTCSKTSERVRKAMLDIVTEVVQMLEKGGNIENIVASDEMRDSFKEFKDGLSSIELFDLLSHRHGVDKEDKKTLMFYLDGLKYKRSDSKYNKSYCIDTKVFDDNAITILNRKVGAIIKFFKEDPRPLRFETEVKSFMKDKKKWSDEECQQIEAYLKADSTEYEWLGQDDFGRHLVALKWESLDAVDSRLVRILYEYGKSHENDPYMDIDDLIKEYNRRALKYGIDSIPRSQSVPRHPHIGRLGNGRFRYTGNASSSSPKIDLPAEIKKYVANNNGIVLVDSALAFAQSLNPKYSIKTVESYLYKAGCVIDTWNKSRYAILNDDDSKNRYQQMTGRTIHSTTGQTTKPRQKKSPKADAIRTKAISILLQAKDNTMAKKELADKLSPDFPGSSLSTNLPKYLNDDVFIMEGSGKGSSVKLDLNVYNTKFGNQI